MFRFPVGWSVIRQMIEDRKISPGLDRLLDRNIAALVERREDERTKASPEERMADIMTRFIGSMVSVYLHAAVFGFWVIANSRVLPMLPVWDPSFTLLAMVASVEAIFLSTFVLITQNRMSAAAAKRAELDLQISLLAEHELTRLISLTSAIADKMHLKTNVDRDLEEMQHDVTPEAVLVKIEKNSG